MKKIMIFKIFGIVGITILVFGTGIIDYSIYLYNGIETFYRMMAITIISLISTLLIFTMIDGLINRKKLRFFVPLVISILLGATFSVGGYVLYKFYSKLDNFNKEEVQYKTSLIAIDEKYSKIESIENIKIGIIEDEENIEGYILPMEYIKEKKLDQTNEIITYPDNLTMMQALYEGIVNSVFISSNYKSMFLNIEGFEDIETKAIEIDNYGKNYKKVNVEDETEASASTITEPFTMLLLGVDSEVDGLNANASFNGDTIMLITFDPKTFHATLLSIPRDTYVYMGCGGSMQKINHAAWGGSNCMVKTVEKFTGIHIDYYMKINFRGVVDLVNSLGGINVDVPVPDYPSAYCLEDSHRYVNNVCLTAGYQTLDGEHALALARVRKAFALGDFQRGQNQQLVVEAILQKAKTIRSVSQFYDVLDAISRNIDTNMTTDQILSLYNVAKSLMFSKDNNMINIQKTFLTGYNLNVWESGAYRFSFHNFQGSLNDIVNVMKIDLGQKEKTPIKTFSFSINNNYEKTIVGYSYSYKEAKRTLVPNLTAYTLSDAENWGANNGITIKKEYVETTEGVDGAITDQSVHEGTLLIKAGNEITLYINKKKSAPIVVIPEVSDEPSDTDPSSEPSSTTPSE